MIAELILFGLFSDHMVLQRGRANLVWGWDKPAQQITVSIEGAHQPPTQVSVVCDASGAWRLLIPELPAGGPYRVRVAGSSEKLIDDVAVGEVWLASGQSNMEWPLVQSEGADQEIAAADYPQVRTIKIPRTALRESSSQVKAEWVSCQPDTAPQFSAIGYYFARDLHRKLGVPVGIINSSWGGTSVEAWTSHQALSPVMPLAKELAALEADAARIESVRAEFQAKQSAWEKANYAQDTGRSAETKEWSGANFDDSAWATLRTGQPWQTQGWEHHGAGWYRATVELPAAMQGKDLELNLGLIDDFDWSFFNGEQVGAMPQGTPNAYSTERRYIVPGRLVKAGKNVIAIRVFDQVGEGGLLGPDSTRWLRIKGEPETRLVLPKSWRAKDESRVPLIGNDIWSRMPAAPSILQLERAPGSLFHGMINPLVGYGLGGVIWYQGENNTSQHADYEARFRALIRDWRTRWGQGSTPFLFVQLASFKADADWPYLREAQEQVLSEPRTGMAVCYDIGNPNDIHPRNKRDVGARLALLARKIAYGETDLVAEGPRLAGVELGNGCALVRFSSAKGLTTSDGKAEVLGFEVAGADGVFHPAQACVEGEMVRVSSTAVPRPQAVRYAWKDYCAVNLINAAGLPAAPFRSDGQ